MNATWITNTLFAGGASPAKSTVAFVWPRTIALVAAGRTDRVETVIALPTRYANDGARLRAGIVAEDIITRPAEEVALFAVIVWLAGDSIRVGETCRLRPMELVGPLVLDG